MGQPSRGDVVVSVEDHLEQVVEEMDAWLNEGRAIRQKFALQLHALRMATSPKLTAALDEIDALDPDGPGLADAVGVDELRRLVTAR